jgi:hypothetical protein
MHYHFIERGKMHQNHYHYPEITNGKIIIGSEYTRCQELLRGWFVTSGIIGTFLFASIYAYLYKFLQKHVQIWRNTYCKQVPSDSSIDLDDPSFDLNLDEDDLDDLTWCNSNDNDSNATSGNMYVDDDNSEYFSTVHEFIVEANDKETPLVESELTNHGREMKNMKQSTYSRNQNYFDDDDEEWEDIIEPSASTTPFEVPTSNSRSTSHQYNHDVLSMHLRI